MPEENPAGQEKEAVSDQKAGGNPERAVRPVFSDIPVREGILVNSGNLRQEEYGMKGFRREAPLQRDQLLFL